MARPIIAVDIDDVLAASAAGWVAFSNTTWGTNLSVEDYDEDWAKMWGIDHQAAVARAAVIHNSPQIVAGFDYDRQAVKVLQKLAKRYELVIATSRVSKHQKETLKWLDRHYKGVFSSINLAGIYEIVTKGSINVTKADLVQKLGADYLIDDQLKHCVGAVNVGVKAILYGDYNWNTSDSLPIDVTRCKDWQAVEEYFSGQH